MAGARGFAAPRPPVSPKPVLGPRFARTRAGFARPLRSGGGNEAAPTGT